MERIHLRAMKADDSVHRRTEGILDVINEKGCAIWTEPGNTIYGPSGPVWVQDSLVRTLFIRGARLNMLEIHDADRTPREVYLNIISPAQLSNSEVVYIDHELDVLNDCRDDRDVQVLDSDEFEKAKVEYSYDDALIAACWKAVALAKVIASDWEFGLDSRVALTTFAEKLESAYA